MDGERHRVRARVHLADVDEIVLALDQALTFRPLRRPNHQAMLAGFLERRAYLVERIEQTDVDLMTLEADCSALVTGLLILMEGMAKDGYDLDPWRWADNSERMRQAEERYALGTR